MPRFFNTVCTSLCALSLSYLCADAPAGMEELIPDAMGELTAPVIPTTSAIEPVSIAPAAPVAPAEPAIIAPTVKVKAPEVPFRPFTGKVKGRKVRLRAQPDLESRVVKELNKNELLSVVGEKNDFWVVEPPTGIKAYVFRSFVLDNVVEGNRVNVRIEPHLEAAVIGHLNAGDHIEGAISPINSKWLEIAPPSESQFYIAKNLVEFAGGPELKEKMDKRRVAVEQLLETTASLSKAELEKPFDKIDFDRVCKGFNQVIADYDDFSEYKEQAQENLTAFQEAYLQKRISYQEAKAAEESARLSLAAKNKKGSKDNQSPMYQITDKMKLWEPVEEALYSSWSKSNNTNDHQQFYEEQKLTAAEITGIIEPYTSPVKSKPGDFIVRDKDVPVAYVYSTQVNLQTLVGKKVTLVAAPRPNNNFAFPAYFVLSVE